MKLQYTMILTLFLSTSCMAKNYVADALCENAFTDVKRADTNIKQQGANLSSMGKRALYKQIQDNVQMCLENCSGDKFNYCNDIARKIESKK